MLNPNPNLYPLPLEVRVQGLGGDAGLRSAQWVPDPSPLSVLDSFVDGQSSYPPCRWSSSFPLPLENVRKAIVVNHKRANNLKGSSVTPTRYRAQDTTSRLKSFLTVKYKAVVFA